MSYSLSQIQDVLRSVGWPENQIAKAAAIVMYESNGNPNAINDGSAGTNEYSVGWFQINTLAHKGYTVAQLKDPILNSQIALQLLQSRPSWGDWYNSNIKYNNNYRGIAAQSRAIYNAGGDYVDNSGIDTSFIYTPDDTQSLPVDDNSLLILLGLGALLLLS